ncbi:helicase associated domain-containing protein, partial [Streptomyces sp. NPDC048196]|uniref:helicase associated domain-containing protein n=1 Tax=Streptomyces sp. NPDC048196 TaxID=3154712 RepID=UPI0034016BDF
HTQADKWSKNYAAARQYYQREGHLQVPRKHIETITVGDRTGDREASGEGAEEHHLRLGTWINNQRSRATTLTPQRVQQLTAIHMRWT